MNPTENKIYLNGLNLLFVKKPFKLFSLLNEVLKKTETISFKEIWENLNNPLKEKIDLEKEWQKIEKENIDLITINDSNYPTLLKEIPYPPLGIYVKGSLLESELKVAVVGTRKPTHYGEMVTKKLVKELIEYNVLIISGLAYGIDALSHKIALENEGKTIAVLASGFYHLTPVLNKKLALKIIENGALISEYHPLTFSYKQNFPWRNRIISGLSQATLVIEAKEKSGALITANFAFKQKRKVFAVPGSIFNPYSLGCNHLIQKGAKLINEGKEIIKELSPHLLKNKKSLKVSLNLTEKEKLILEILKTDEALSLDKILEMTNLKANEAMVVLTELELKGLIKEVSSGNYLKESV